MKELRSFWGVWDFEVDAWTLKAVTFRLLKTLRFDRHDGFISIIEVDNLQVNLGL